MPTDSQLLALRTRIAPAAVACERATRVPAEVSCAQCILESDYLLKMQPGSNNAFGIKARPGAPAVLVATHEVFTGEELARFLALGNGRTAVLDPPQQPAGAACRYLARDWFAKYASLAESFEAHAQLLTRGGYGAALRQYFESGDLRAYLAAIALCYATDPEYAKVLTEIALSDAVVRECAALRVATVGY